MSTDSPSSPRINLRQEFACRRAAKKPHPLTQIRQSVLLASSIITVALTISVVGYHILGELRWVDAVLEASMILGGMGPVSPMINDSVKLFASVYALFSGLILLTTTGVLLAPFLHRLMYHTHRIARHDAQADEGRTP